MVPPVASFLTSPVERGLVRELGGRPWMRNAVLPFGHRDSVGGQLSAEQLEACARRVPGWDVIIVLYSYGSGGDVLDHPALRGCSSDLRDAV
ncbi:MAG TPA: hypothetical protein VMV01_13720, partial [Planctomycetota bacterium]|nr:hypothetical protein [Planctomycetota bacterium]